MKTYESAETSTLSRRAMIFLALAVITISGGSTATPAEEAVGGKLYMVRAGLFDDLDVALAWHPGDEIVADFASTQDALQVGLAALTGEKLVAKAPFSPGNDENETVGSLIAGLVFVMSRIGGRIRSPLITSI